MPDVLALGYHAVSEEWPANLSVTPAQLDAQLRALAGRGYEGTTFGEAVLGNAAHPVVAATFDDAYRSVLDHAFPVLERLGMRGTVFVVTDFADRGGPLAWPGIEQWLGSPYEDELLPLSWDDLRHLAQAGWEIGSHTCSHPRLTTLDDDALSRELRASRQRCEEELGSCRSLAFPYGDWDARVARAAAETGYTTACTLPGRLTPDRWMAWPRIGVYHGDGPREFALKTSRPIRLLRRTGAWERASRLRSHARPDRSPHSTERLKVLTLIDRPTASGGGERVATMLATRLDPERFESILCSTRAASERLLDTEVERSGIRVLGLDRTSRFDLGPWRSLLSLLRRERIDVLHAHKFGSNVWGTLLGRLARVPVVVAHEHSWSYSGDPVRVILDRELIARFADVFVAVSAQDRRRMIDVEGIEPSRVRVVTNAVPDGIRTGNDVRSELSIPVGAFVVAAVGELRPVKCFELLVEAAALLTPRLPGLRVLIAGEGEERHRLTALVAQRGLEGTVALLGFRRDVADVLASCDVAVCCSVSEGSPLSVLEYMAAGKPVVATRVGGIPALVEDGANGLLVPPNNAIELARAIESLAIDPARLAELGRRGRERHRTQFGVEGFVRRIEALYEELYATRRPAG